MSFERTNLAYVVRQTENKASELLHILQRMEGSAILYVRNRRRTKEVTEWLQQTSANSGGKRAKAASW